MAYFAVAPLCIVFCLFRFGFTLRILFATLKVVEPISCFEMVDLITGKVGKVVGRLKSPG